MEQKKTTVNTDSLFERALEARNEALKRSDEHHLEFIRETNGVTYINDARSLRLSSTRFSLESIDAPIILIMGGELDHENDYFAIQLLIRKKVEAIVYMGENTTALSKICMEESKILVTVSAFKEAIEVASYCAKPGNVVLFSPACNCVKGMINNREFGDMFRKIVMNL